VLTDRIDNREGDYLLRGTSWVFIRNSG